MKKMTIIERDNTAQHKFTVNHEGHDYNYVIQEPNFDQLSAALTESVGMSGKLNMSGGGKVIWELCCKEFDPEIEKNSRLLMAVCISLYNDFVLPADAEIKKN